MVQGGMSCVKYLMFVFNFIFVVCGIALIIIGAVVQKKYYMSLIESKYYVTAPTIIIIVGVIIFLLAFLGCCGAIRENHCMVMMFGILLFLVFVVEIAGGITAYVNRNKLDGILEGMLSNTLHQESYKDLWNRTQHDMKCCGVNGSSDYPHAQIPPSCCPQEAEHCSETNAFPGCYSKLKDEIMGSIAIVGGVAIGIAVVELIGVMFSWCLASAIKREYEGV